MQTERLTSFARVSKVCLGGACNFRTAMWGQQRPGTTGLLSQRPRSLFPSRRRAALTAHPWRLRRPVHPSGACCTTCARLWLAHQTSLRARLYVGSRSSSRRRRCAHALPWLWERPLGSARLGRLAASGAADAAAVRHTAERHATSLGQRRANLTHVEGTSLAAAGAAGVWACVRLRLRQRCTARGAVGGSACAAERGWEPAREPLWRAAQRLLRVARRSWARAP